MEKYFYFQISFINLVSPVKLFSYVAVRNGHTVSSPYMAFPGLLRFWIPHFHTPFSKPNTTPPITNEMIFFAINREADVVELTRESVLLLR